MVERILAVYFGIGAVAALSTFLWRICRSSGSHVDPREHPVVFAIFSADVFGLLVMIAIWPVAVPLVVWSYSRMRKTPRFIREDEPWPPSRNEPKA